MMEILNAKLQDYILVKVDGELNEFAGLIKDDQGKEHNLYLNPNWQPTHHVKICAQVVNAPVSLTGADSVLHEKYPGLPRPIQYRGHDEVRAKVLTMSKADKKNYKMFVPYRCESFQAEYETLAGKDPVVKAGDISYFHYGSLLKPENFLFREREYLYYRIHYSDLFCVVRDGVIIMLNSYVFVSPIEEQSQDFNGVKGKVKGSLITVDLQKKNKHLTGVLEHIGAPVSSDSRDVSQGTSVIFRPQSEFKNTIEGREYYTMRQWDLVAYMKLNTDFAYEYESKPTPIGDYVMLKPQHQEIAKTTVTHIYDQRLPNQKFKPGELFILPETASMSGKKKFHKYGFGEVIACGENCKKNWGGRVMFGKGLYYLYLEEYDVVFVREGDLYGEF